MAIDVQGAEKVRPWIENADATYVALVDRDNRLGSLFGFNYVPLTLLFDEDGRLARGPAPFQPRPAAYDEIEAWIAEGESTLLRSTSRAKPEGFESAEARLRFDLVARLLRDGDRQGALAHLKKAWRKDEGNWLILKQIWALENPERFYEGPVDFGWQREQMQKIAREKEGR